MSVLFLRRSGVLWTVRYVAVRRGMRSHRASAGEVGR